jgi:hypothetical protein
VPGIFACGNVLQVHDLVDNVSAEAQVAGRSAACYVKGEIDVLDEAIAVKPGDNITYVVPQQITSKPLEDEKVVKLYMRVREPKEHIKLVVTNDAGDVLASYKRDIIAPGSMEMVPLLTKYVAAGQKGISVSVEEV